MAEVAAVAPEEAAVAQRVSSTRMRDMEAEKKNGNYMMKSISNVMSTCMIPKTHKDGFSVCKITSLVVAEKLTISLNGLSDRQRQSRTPHW